MKQEKTGFTVEERKRYLLNKHIKDHLFEYILDLFITVGLMLLILYLCEAESYLPGIVSAMAISVSKAEREIRNYKKDYLDFDIREKVVFRKAVLSDVAAVAKIYEEIHTEEEAGRVTIGWERGVYPTKTTANAALDRGDLYVGMADGEVFGAAIINRQQVDVYEGAAWVYPARDEEVMVLHTLVISPKSARQGYGEAFVRFYEDYAQKRNCSVLRIDTNERNLRARAMYQKLGYRESDMVPCRFNGIDGVHLVLLEKKL